MDTKYIVAAFDEFMLSRPGVGLQRVGDLMLAELRVVLGRAQQLKDADAAARAEERGKPVSIITHGDNRNCPNVQSGQWKRCQGHQAIGEI